MTPLLGLLLAASPCHGDVAPIAIQATVTVDHPVITLGDVADLSRLPLHLRPQAATIELVRLQPRSGATRLGRHMILSRARAQMPVISCSLPGGDASKLSTQVTLSMAQPEVRRVQEAETGQVRPHDMLDLTSSAGVVRVTRQVEAVQAGRPNQRLFVRTSDGELMSVRLADQSR